jgi:dihydrofolate reductase
MMGKVVLGMTISLDGFVNDRNGDVGRLYPDIANLRNTEVVQEAIRTTGAVVMGRHAYDMAQGDFTGYEFQTPIFVLTHHIPEEVAKGENENLRFYFVTDGIEGAIEKAKIAAGDKNVAVIGGADTAQQLLNAGLVDELEVDIAPVLFGAGLRLFENLDVEQIELEQIKVLEYRGVTHMKYRLAK